MFGNKYITSALALMAALALAATAFGGQRKLPGRSFRFGLDLEPGFKFINGSGFQFNAGLIFKFNEKISLIPHIGMYPYQYINKTSYTYLSGYDPITFAPIYSTQTLTDTMDNTAMNIGLTLRVEILKEVPTKNTRYEYDSETQEFIHYRYYEPLRPYLQFHLGTFMGAGGGVNYYLSSASSIGLGCDIGYNLTAKDSKGLGIIPKGVLTFGF
ncbi:MAG: hypothetical protein Q8O74_07335 [bacterium]|nr:hypothetical protein [bacterium]